jgi:Cu2+-exporting ATPase
MEQGLGKLCELRDIARDLERNVRNSWIMILVPNIACIVGVFTLGFGIGASVVTNNVAALGALANGLWPMRKVAQLEAERRHLFELQLRQSGFLLVDGSQLAPAELESSGDPAPAQVLAALGDAEAKHHYRAVAAAAD